jgi:hypothetical protein
VRLRLKLEVPARSDLVAFGWYAAAAAVYVAIGVAWIDFLFSFWVGVGYLLLTVWLLPAALRRLR